MNSVAVIAVVIYIAPFANIFVQRSAWIFVWELLNWYKYWNEIKWYSTIALHGIYFKQNDIIRVRNIVWRKYYMLLANIWQNVFARLCVCVCVQDTSTILLCSSNTDTNAIKVKFSLFNWIISTYVADATADLIIFKCSHHLTIILIN